MDAFVHIVFFVTWISGFVFANEGSLPVIKEQPSSVIARRNDPATLNCAASDATHITWFRDGQQVVTSSQDTRSHRVLLPSGSLFFLRVASGRRDSDAGNYWCVATNQYGSTRSANATLTVASLSYDFQAFPEPSVKVLAGEPVTLSCRAPRGSPEPSLSWLRDGKEVQNSSHVVVTNFGDLVIKPTEQDHSGTYVCRAKNIAGTRESPASKLVVMTPPWFEVNPKNVTAASGVNVEFACQVKGHPTPSVTWRRLDGKMPTSRIKTDNQRLTIEEAEASDTGVYICEAQSEAGFTEAKVFLTVFEAPELAQRPQNTQVLEGEKVQLSCIVKGDPEPLVLWRLPALDRSALLTPSQKNGHISVSSDGQTLTISPTATRDSGNYQCWGVSNGGGVSAQAEVMVVDAYPPPVIGVGPQDISVKPGSDVSLPCEVVSEAATPTITWWFQPAAHIPSYKLTEGNENTRISLPNTGALLLKNVQASDAGIYTCRVTAETGSAEQEAVLQVKESAPDIPTRHPPAPPSKPRLFSVNETSVQLSWLPNSQMDSNTEQWYLIEHWQQGWDEWRVAAADIRQESFTVTALTPGNTYFFFVRAISNEGKSFPSPWSDSVIVRPSRDLNLTSNQVRQVRRRLSRPAVTLTEAEITNSNSVLLKWRFINAAEDAVEGVLVYAVSASGSVQVATVLGSSSSSHHMHNLQQYTNYTFFVAPFWHSIEGTPSNAIKVTTPEDVPVSAPSDVHIILQKDGSTLITWSSLESDKARGVIIGYQVVITNNGTQTTEMVQDPRLEAHGLTPGRLYAVRVAAVTGAGIGPFSPPVLLDGGTKIDHSNQNVPLIPRGDNTSVLYAQPQPAWLVYLLVPLVIILFFATIMYIRHLRHKIPVPKPSQANSVYQDPSLYPAQHTINMYSEQKLWPSSDSDKDSSLSSSRLLRSDQQINDYSEPRVQRIDEATEPYATTALLAQESPHLIHGPPWRHHSDDSGVQVNWSAILPPPPSCPPPHDFDLGDPVGFTSPREVHIVCAPGSSSHRSSVIGSEQYKRPCDASSDHTYDIYTQMTPNSFRNGFRTFNSLQSCDCKQNNKECQSSNFSSTEPPTSNTH
ncbi:LOW QUALITY PROTEIN: protein sax-3-like [Macrobrachium nipponense]|uniref:LOW QUALITY PROTEIN: protein sax-3-like n=1 Tax=Macrobrachium nipponense TaxID=159736 RepID=UPI0030C7F168